MNNYQFLVIFYQQIESLMETHFPSISMMSSMLTSFNWCQKMCSLSRNSCAKAFGQGVKNLRQKNSRGSH